MADLTFKTTNLLNFTDVPQGNWVLNNAAWVNDELVIQPNGYAYVDIPSTLLDQTSIYYKLYLEFTGDIDVSNSFAPTGNIYVDAEYNSGKREDYYLLLNRLSEVSVGVYEDTTILETNGTKIDSMRVWAYVNNTSSAVTISIIELYQSQDTDPSTLVDVSLEAVLAAEVMNALNVWSSLLVVDSVETNVSVKQAINPYVERRDFIKMFENTIEFREEQLNELDYEQLVLDDGQGNTYPVWYTSIPPADDAYQFVTITDPEVFIEGITPAQKDNFRYMVRTASSTAIKMAIKFLEFESGGETTTIPTIELGQGTTGDPASKWGKGYIYKDAEGLVIEYYSGVDGTLRQMKMTDDGIFFTPDIGIEVLESLEFYDDGFVPTYASGRVLWYWTKDIDGKIIQLDSNLGDTITISHNTGNIPYS